VLKTSIAFRLWKWKFAKPRFLSAEAGLRLAAAVEADS
jgi:hypothetical protein